MRRRLAWLTVAFGLPFLVFASPSLAFATTTTSLRSFDLVGTNTAVSPDGGGMTSPGDWITVKGSGTFDAASMTVSAKGSFVHHNADGTVHCSGTWKATSFSSFTDFGVNANGEEGGVLSLVVSHSCKMMGSMAGIPMTVTSTVNAPAGSSYVEGTTMGAFTEPTGGAVVIQPQQ